MARTKKTPVRQTPTVIDRGGGEEDPLSLPTPLVDDGEVEFLGEFPPPPPRIQPTRDEDPSDEVQVVDVRLHPRPPVFVRVEVKIDSPPGIRPEVSVVVNGERV